MTARAAGTFPKTSTLRDVMDGREFDEVYAQNYDSPYLFYPLINPHGANQSGIVTLSRHPISSAVRRSLPIETSVMKLVDPGPLLLRQPHPDGKRQGAGAL